MSKRLAIALGSALLAVALAAGATFALTRGGTKLHVTGNLVDRRVPPLRLLDEQGRPTSLAAFRGKIVVLAPFLTLCHEVCPMTTGAFMRMRHVVEQAGLGDRVAFVEATVDPWRDSPARLRAYKRMTRLDFHLLTGTKAEIARLWRFFGVAYARTPQGHPPDVDWWTNKPESFDVSHTDGLFLIDASGHERIVDVGMANVGGRLSPSLLRLLNETGRQNLAHPEAAWTVAQALGNVAYLLGRAIPGAGAA